MRDSTYYEPRSSHNPAMTILKHDEQQHDFVVVQIEKFDEQNNTKHYLLGFFFVVTKI